MAKYVKPEMRKLLKAKEQAQKRGCVSEEAKYCNVLGEMLKREGDLRGALREHETELQLCDSIRDRMGVAIANRRVGECKSEMGQYEEGLRHHKLYLRIAKGLGNLLEEQRALATIGRNCYFYALSLPEPDSSKHLELSKDAILESLKCCEKLETSKGASEKVILEMKARLYSNLSNYYEQKENLSLAKQYSQKAILLSKSHDFCCANFYLSLGSIHLACKEYNEALRQFNMALRQAEKDSDKPMRCHALEQMGTVFAILRDFSAAKQAWKSSLKIGGMSEEEEATLQTRYMQMSTLLECLETRRGLHKEDFKRQIELLERLGDTACRLELYLVGVNFYKEELALAETSGYGKVAEICCSIAVTYADLKDYENAIVYYELELKQSSDEYRNNCRILKVLGDAHYEAGHSYAVVNGVYDRARLEGEELGDTRPLLAVWKSLLRLYEREGREEQVRLARMAIEDLSPDLSDSCDSCDSGDEEDEVQQFVLSESDISEAELEELQEGTTPVSSVRRAKNTQVDRVNTKGETKLQEAAIQGRTDMARILLKQGAVVNTRDNCGWTPLHEACNFGNTEMALVLLEYGASVNDPGGQHCQGITPLHDAVENEHYSCVKLLVEFGADPFLKNKSNESAVDIARTVVEAKDCSIDQQRINKKILELLSSCPANTYSSKPLSVGLNPLHKKRTPALDSPPPLVPECSSPVNSQSWLVEDMGYKHKRIRMSPRFKSVRRSSPERLEPYILKSPVKPSHRARKQTKHKQRRSAKPSVNKLKLSATPVRDSNTSVLSLEDTLSSDSFAFFGACVANEPIPSVHVQEYELAHSSPDRLSERCSASNVSTRLSEVKLCQDVKRVKVTIESDQIKIPCQGGQTISWLCEEASKRYCSLRGIKPLLQLTDRSGALLMPMDRISDILSNEEEVMGRVESWDLPSLRDRYKQYCTTHGVTVCERLVALLPDLAIENELNLSNRMLPSSELTHLFKCISAQCHLARLDLSSNMIGDEAVKVLACSLCNLTSLLCLSLSCCSISCRGVTSLLTQIVTQQGAVREPLQGLLQLDMSFNFICGDGGRALSQFLAHTPNLQSLRLESCGLENCTEFLLLSQSIGRLQYLKELSLIFNKIKESNIAVLLRSLPGNGQVNLKLSHNN